MTTGKYIRATLYNVRPVINALKRLAPTAMRHVSVKHLGGTLLTPIGRVRIIMGAVARKAAQMDLKPEDLLSDDGIQALEALIATVSVEDAFQDYARRGNTILILWEGTVDTAMDELEKEMIV